MARIYQRIGRKKLVFDVCGAPFGKGFFVSWWMGPLPNPVLGKRGHSAEISHMSAASQVASTILVGTRTGASVGVTGRRQRRPACEAR